jgi:molecular chaperone GrpE
MDETMIPQDESAAVVELAAEPASDIAPEIEYVVPAAVYDTVATDDELAPRPFRSEPEPPRADFGATLEAIGRLDETIGKRFDHLQALFEREIRAETTRERVVDRLHAELQEYKQDLLLKLLRPIFIDLIQLHDDIGKLMAGAGETDSAGGRWAEAFRNVQQGIEDVLYRQGVEPFAVEGAAFDPRRQRAVSTQSADDPALAKTVATRHRKGFQAGDRIIRPEIVSVYAAGRPL